MAITSMSLKRISLLQYLAWVVLLMGVSLSAVNSYYIKHDIEQEAIRNLGFATDQVTTRIEERLAAYALVLRGAAGLFSASEYVSRSEWRSYYSVLEVSESITGVQGVGFAMLIPPDQLASHIATVQAEGFPDYIVRPEGPRDIYTSIIYLEPFNDMNQRAFGYDMYSEPVRRAAMEQARDTGQATLSGKVLLVQETETAVQAGTLMYVPIYRNGASLNTVADRRSALIGWSYSPYRMTDLMVGILDTWEDVDLQALHLDIHAGTTLSPDSLLFTNQPGEHQTHSSTLSQQRTLDFNGTQWLLEFNKLDTAADLDYSLAATGFFVGTAFSILLFIIILTITVTQQRALRIADRLTYEIRERDQQLQDSEQRWRFATDGAGDGMWDWNLLTNKVLISQRCKDMLGITVDIPDLVKEWEDRLHPEDKSAVLSAFKDYLEGRTDKYATEQRLRCEDGSYKWILERGSIVSRTPDGKPERVIGTWTDITERKQADIALQAAHAEAQNLRDALDFVNSYIYMKDRDRRYTYANRVTLELFGIEADDLPGSTDARFFPPATLEQLQLVDERVLRGEKTKEEIEQVKPDGTRITYLEIKTPIYERADKSRITGILGISTDITLLKDYQVQLERMAHHDPLTQLPNRVLLVDRLTQAMAQAGRHKQSLALVYLDLDGFKKVNDDLGHAAGDKFLVTLSNRMRTALRQGDTLARLGGDEFVAVLLDVPDKTVLKQVLTRLMDAICEPVAIEGELAQVGASMGVVFYPQDEDITPEKLLILADQTMYKAKLAGKHRVYLYGDNTVGNGGLLT